MIIRSWRGRATHANHHAYIEHFRHNVLPELHAIEGFKGAELLKQVRGDEIEFQALTRWSSMESIQKFAGEDVTRAVVEPEAVAALTSFDERVEHFEVIISE